MPTAPPGEPFVQQAPCRAGMGCVVGQGDMGMGGGTLILEVVGKREGLGEKMTLCGIAG